MDSCLCVFAKAPVSGHVKTRLLPVLTEQQACAIHENLLRHCLSQTQHSNWESQLWSPDISHSYIKTSAKQHGMSVHKQQGGDLGERMAFAVRESLKKFSYVVIVGTDCPDIDSGLIATAVEYLKSGSDVVLGPASDGGYVLIGFSIVADNIFSDIEWGTSHVLETTRDRLRVSGLSWHELATKRDIDRPEDLHYLQQAYPEMFHSTGVSLSFPQSDHEPG